MQNPFKDKFHHLGYRFLQLDAKGRIHPGVDLNATGTCNEDLGVPVYPMHDGEIVDYYDDGGKTGWGKMIMLFHPDLNLWSVYAHIDSPISTLPRWVKQTEQLCVVSNAYGRWCAHIHFELRKKKLPINFYPPKSWTKEKVLEDYIDPLGYIINNLTPNPMPEISGGECQKLVFGLTGDQWSREMAEAKVNDPQFKLSDFLTELLQLERDGRNVNEKHFEKIENGFECLAEKGSCEEKLKTLNEDNLQRQNEIRKLRGAITRVRNSIEGL